MTTVQDEMTWEPLNDADGSRSPSGSELERHRPLDLIELVAIVVRRWVVVATVLLLTVVVAVVVAGRTAPTYTSTGSLLLTVPTPAVSRPMVENVAISPSIAGELLRGADARDELRAAEVETSYTIEVNSTAGIVGIRASSDSDELAAASVETLLDFLGRTVADRQEEAGIPETSLITVEVLAATSVASAPPVTEAPDEEQQPSFVAFGSARLVDPAEQVVTSFGTDHMIRVLTEVMLSPRIAARILGDADTATYRVTSQPRDPAPILSVETTATDPDVARQTFDATVEALRDALISFDGVALGDGADAPRLEYLVEPTDARLQSTNLIRPIVTICGLGGVLAVSLAVVADARRRRVSPGPRQVGEGEGEADVQVAEELRGVRPT